MKSLMKWIMVSTAMISTNAMAEETTLCTVNDTSGTDLNVRASAPNGRVVGRYWNGARVRVLDVQYFDSFGQQKPWAKLGDNSGGVLGWVYFPYLICPPSALPKSYQATAPSPPPGPVTPPRPAVGFNSNDGQFDKIFSFPMYDNVYGITLLGDLPLNESTPDDFKKVVLSLLRDNKLVGSVFLYSPGGSSGSGQNIARQIRILRARTWAPLLATDGKTRICMLNPRIDDEGNFVKGSFGQLTYDKEENIGDNRCTCASACFSMWAGGTGRSGNVLGVHRYGHWEYKDKFAWFTTEEARQYYADLGAHKEWFKTMGITDNVITLFETTPFYSIRWLTKEEINQQDNFPIFLQELIYARCGPEANPNASSAEKIKARACRKGIIIEEYKIGAREYLSKYGNN
jgi:hypothetical protein